MLTAQPRGPEAVIGTVCDFLHGRVVGSGPVSKLELTCKNGFDVGTLYIGGLEATFWNEFMTLEREGERLATFPDLITMLDAKTGMPVTSATAEESAAASEELSSQSQLMKDLVGRFRLRG